MTQIQKESRPRISSGMIINEIAAILPELMGGSADLAPSNKTWINSSTAFQSDNPGGRNLHFGVREHGMGAVVNGMTYHKGLDPLWSNLPYFFRLYARSDARFSNFTLAFHLGFHT